ncbi:MAG: hypothetical protein B6I26_07705 [Desulfobacteraceae bacterium 4572_130]|nr:MAG: hypothetical protein B6I26_07705 [Desulfobacteraceae bacterium 4572_130]
MMKKIFKHIFSIYFIILLSFCSFSNAETGKLNNPENKILKKIEDKYLGKNFTGNFHQISTLKAIDITEKAFGKVFFGSSGKMKWEYYMPEKHQIITNGETLWIYRPEQNQIIKGTSLEFFQTGAGGSFLSNISSIKKNYKISIKKNNDSFINILLIPKQKNPQISLIEIKVLKKNDEIKKIITSNIYGDTTEIEFKDIQFKKLDDSMFEFIIPKGTDILFMKDNIGKN